MNGGKSHAGYTIVEVMIVLAVSGIMFLIAANFISGKQARTAFTSGTNTFTSRMQEVATQVQTGQYSDVNFGCTATATSISINSNDTNSQGTNSDCIFMGKFIHFSVGGDTKKYDVMMLAGKDGETTYDSARAITPGADSQGTLDLTSHFDVPQGLEVKKVMVGGNQQVYGFAFLQDMSGASSNQLTIGYLPTSSLVAGASESAAATAIDVSNLSTLTDPKVTICLTDGTRYGVVEFGSDANGGSAISAKLKVTKLTGAINDPCG